MSASVAILTVLGGIVAGGIGVYWYLTTVVGRDARDDGLAEESEPAARQTSETEPAVRQTSKTGERTQPNRELGPDDTHRLIEPDSTAEELTERHDEVGEGVGTKNIDRGEIESLVADDTQEKAFLVTVSGDDVGRMIELDSEQIIGRDEESTDIWFRDQAVSSRHARLRADGGDVELVDLGSSNGTFVNGERVERASLDDGDKVVLGESIVLKLTFQDELDEEFQKRMYESSTKDELTGAYKKAHFFAQMENELAYAERHGSDICLIMFDIDHFKPINDTHGHLAGDEILQELSDVVRSVTRSEAMFVRYGGEEFIVVERNTGSDNGEIVAQRIRQSIQAHVFEHDGERIEVTVSVGVADLGAIEDLDTMELVEAADEALYQSKENGRNRVTIAE